VFEALIGVDPDAGKEIDPQSEANFPENIAPGDFTHFPGVRDPANVQDKRSLVELPSPDGRGCREAAGEGYNMNSSPERSVQVRHLVPQFMPETEGTTEQPAALSQLVPNRDHDNQKSAFELPVEGLMLYPSPAAPRHPLPSGEGLSSLPPHFRQAAPAKSVTPLQIGDITDDLALLIRNLAPVAIAPAHSIKPATLNPETGIESSAPSIDANETRIPERLNLAEFGVTRFEYKTETEPHLSQVFQSAQMLQMMRTSPSVRDIKAVKPASSFDTVMQNSSSQSDVLSRSVVLTRPDEVQHVRLVFEPPPPPPVVRSVSMDIGDPESQVRVVIRERNGNLNVQVGSMNERLHEDLQVAGPMLMRELQRNNPMPVTLDFSNFGSATDADSQSRPDSRAKKFLKPDAEFADVVETAHRPDSSSELKSL